MTFKELVSTNDLVLIDFFATWCEPCKWVEPVLDDVMTAFPGKIILHKIDIDAQSEIARQHHILSVPTLLLFKNGIEVWRMRGFDTAPALKKIFAGYL